MEKLLSFLGLFVFIGICYLFSSNRKKVNFKLVGLGLGAQLLFAILILGIPSMGISGALEKPFQLANNIIVQLLGFTTKGSEFIFGPLVQVDKIGGFIFAVQVLPTIIFFSALTSIFYYLGVLQWVVELLGRVMQKVLGTSGAESLSAAANIFVGQTEAPLVIKPFIKDMTQSELLAVMTGGMATVAGGVMAAYVGLLVAKIPNIAGHLLTASILSAPAALVIAKILMPETEKPKTLGVTKITGIPKDRNIIEAIAKGTTEGVGLAINVGAMLIVFTAMIYLMNALLGGVGGVISFETWGQALVPESLKPQDGTPVALSLELVLGLIFSPLAWLMGIPWNEAVLSGSLLGQKVVLNEFVAYLNLSNVAAQLSDRTVIILSYALCGFANFASIGIQIGGIGGLAPERKGDLAALGLKSVLGGTLAAFMTASIAGLLI